MWQTSKPCHPIKLMALVKSHISTWVCQVAVPSNLSHRKDASDSGKSNAMTSTANAAATTRRVSSMPPTGKPKRSGHEKREPTLDGRSIFFTSVNVVKNGGIRKWFWTSLSSNPIYLPAAPKWVSKTWKQLRQKCQNECDVLEDIDRTTMMTTMPDAFFATKKKLTGQNARKWNPEDIGEALKEMPRSLTKRLTLHCSQSGLTGPSQNVLLKSHTGTRKASRYSSS